MANTANITAIITAEDKASAVIKGFSNNVDSSASKMSSSLTASVVAVSAATTGIVAFGKKSLDAWNEQDLATTRLQAGINNVKSATDKNINSLIKESQELQKHTRFSDEAYISAQGILTTFQLNQDAIKKLTPRLADMSEGLARVTGEMPDLEGNAILVAKAIGGEDVVGLVGALRRVGVVMTKYQTEMLQTGTVQERVSVITQVLDQNFRGMADAAGGTTAGKITELKNKFNDLQESVGKIIAEALTPLLNILNQHPAVLTTVTFAVLGLTTAFVGLKVAAAVQAVMGAAAASIAAVGGAATSATGAVTALSAVSLAGWAIGIAGAAGIAAGAIYNIVNALGMAHSSQNKLNANIQPLIDSLRKGGHKSEADQLQARLNAANAALPKFASGTDFAPGGMALVGERGPELVNLPRGAQVIPNNKLGQSGNTIINIAPQIGVYTGTPMERRKLALQMLSDLRDLANQKNTSVANLLGANRPVPLT